MTKGVVTQKAFFNRVAETGAVYHGNGVFGADDLTIRIEAQKLCRFLDKLSGHIGFENYDRLTRKIWVEAMTRKINGP